MNIKSRGMENIFKNGTYVTQKYNIWKEIFTGHAAY